jgi:hypothetical protein
MQDEVPIDTLSINLEGNTIISEHFELRSTGTASTLVNNIDILTHETSGFIIVQDTARANSVGMFYESLPEYLIRGQSMWFTLRIDPIAVTSDTCHVILNSTNGQSQYVRFFVKLLRPSFVNSVHAGGSKFTINAGIVSVFNVNVSRLLLHDISGRLIRESNEPRMSVEQLAPGPYLLVCTYSDRYEVMRLMLP